MRPLDQILFDVDIAMTPVAIQTAHIEFIDYVNKEEYRFNHVLQMVNLKCNLTSSNSEGDPDLELFLDSKITEYLNK